MKVLFAVCLVVVPLLTEGGKPGGPPLGLEEQDWFSSSDRGDDDAPDEDAPADISEKQQCYVPGQCQEHSVNFHHTNDADICHKFCGAEEGCNWWSFEPDQDLCLLFTNCTTRGSPDQAICPDCISGEKMCPARECHGAFKCEGHFIDSFEIDHLEDCIKACSDDELCMWYTIEKTHNHCVLYEDCDVKNDCHTCASGPRDCSVGFHGCPVDNDTDYGGANGNDVNSSGQPNVESCRSFCKKTADYFTFTQPWNPRSGSRHERETWCWCKKRNNHKGTHAKAVSGSTKCD